MPIPLQIKMIREILLKANPELAEEIDFKTEDFVYDNTGERRYWTELLEEGLSLTDNLSVLEQEIPNVKWRVPKKLKEPRKSQEYIFKGPEGPVYCKESETVICSAKGRERGIEYEHGRIQIILPKELINSMAYVRVQVPNPPEIKKKVRRHKRDLRRYKQPFDPEYYEDMRKLEIRKARKEIKALASPKSKYEAWKKSRKPIFRKKSS